jgi:hypothetical protein
MPQKMPSMANKAIDPVEQLFHYLKTDSTYARLFPQSIWKAVAK